MTEATHSYHNTCIIADNEEAIGAQVGLSPAACDEWIDANQGRLTVDVCGNITAIDGRLVRRGGVNYYLVTAKRA